MEEEWKAWVAVTFMPPTWAVPPFMIGSRVLDALALQVGHDLEVGDRPRAGLPAQRLTSSKWSKWPWVMSMVSSSPTCFRSSGVVRVVRQERVYDDLLVARRHEPERRVSEVGDPGSA